MQKFTFSLIKLVVPPALLCAVTLLPLQLWSLSKLEVPRISIEKLIVHPSHDGHADWIQKIKGAQKSVHMTMFHITNEEVIQALITRSQSSEGKSPFDLRIILNKSQLNGGYKKAYDRMIAAGLNIRIASPQFSISHSKAMVVDGNISFVSTINLVNTTTSSRDVGIVTNDPTVAEELEKVFEADWRSAAEGSGSTPALETPHLVWSPENSIQKLVRLIDSSEREIVVAVENIGSRELASAFERAVLRKVKVRILIPMCHLGEDPFLNYRHLKDLKQKGVQTRILLAEKDGSPPHLHTKFMQVDGEATYLGSINFSFNSTMKAREVGILFANPTENKRLKEIFETDWAQGIDSTGDPTEGTCPLRKPKFHDGISELMRVAI